MMYATFLAALLLSASLGLAVPTNVTIRPVGFAASPDINAQGILNAAKAARRNMLAAFPSRSRTGNNVKIFGDWLKLDGVSAMHFIADMDVDCDGVDYKCKGNPDGQPQTSFGRLSATRVPFYVLPVRFYEQNKAKIRPNSLGVVVCNGKMFYSIFGDEDGDNPQVIGEASILLAQTCFPGEKLGGDKGHVPLNVLYIVFGQDVPPGVGKETIDIAALKRLGDQQARKLATALGVR